MVWPVVIADFKAYFVREFVYGTTTDKVMDADITRALAQAGMSAWDEGAWNSDDEKATAYLYLAAHFLKINIDSAGGLSVTSTGKGIKSDARGLVTSKSVGSVSLSEEYAQRVKDDPILNPYLKTWGGQSYLALMLPRIPRIYVIGGQVSGGYVGE